MKKNIFLISATMIGFLTLVAFMQQRQIWSTVARGASLPANVPRSGYLFFRTSDNVLHVSDGSAWTMTKPLLLDFLGQGLVATTASGASDSTAFYIPMKMFSLSDTATFDFGVADRFVQLDSIVIVGGTISATGDSAALSLQLKQTLIDGGYAGAFGTAKIDTIDLGTGNIRREWRFTSLGSFTDERSTLRGKVWRSACTNNAAADVFVERVLIYGRGLR